MQLGEKKLIWPFLKTFDGSMAYAPFGRYGYVYTLPDIRTRYRIEQAYTSAYVALYLTFIALPAADFFCRGQEWEGVEKQLFLAIACLVVAFHLSVICRQSRGLKIASRRSSLNRFCTLAAQSVLEWQIWTVQYSAILLALIIIPGLQKHYQESTIQSVTAGLFIAAFVAVNLLCSYVLHLKQRHSALLSPPLT